MFSFYKGKRVLITGHTGFKGSWLGLLLSKMGANVSGISFPPLTDSLYTRLPTDTYLDSYICDICDLSALKQKILQISPEIIIHLAAKSVVPSERTETLPTLQTNIIGLANLLEAVDETPSVRSVVIVTSDKCYQNTNREEAYDENSPLGCDELYSASKAAAELVVHGYYKSILSKKDIRVATARASNVLGGGDFNTTRLIPHLIQCFLQGETAVIRNPGFIRPWQNVLDVLYGYLLLAKALYEKGEEFCSPFNFGPASDSFASVEELVQLVIPHFTNANYTVCTGNIKTEAKVLKLSSKKANELLNWNAKFILAQTVAMTADFHKRIYAGESAMSVCGFYIDQYLKEVKV